MSKPAKIRVVIVEPGQYAREAEIDNTLQAEQAVVGGSIEVIYPWPDKNVCLVLNDEGKVIPLEPNRGLLEYRDIVFGTFFVCGDNGEDFCSLSDLQVKRFLQRFSRPEVFIPYCGHLLPILYDRRDLPNVPEAVRQETKERNGLPQICFSDMPGIPEVVLLEYGENRCLPLSASPEGKTASQYADELNEQIGVTPDQQRALQRGFACGWKIGPDDRTDKKHSQDMTR